MVPTDYLRGQSMRPRPLGTRYDAGGQSMYLLPAVVAGGQTNTGSGAYTSIGGGNLNTASGIFDVVGGASNNAAGDYGTIAGGQSNTVSGSHGSTGGGQSNKQQQRTPPYLEAKRTLRPQTTQPWWWVEQRRDSCWSGSWGCKDSVASGAVLQSAGGDTNSVTAAYGSNRRKKQHRLICLLHCWWRRLEYSLRFY